jgi:ABC-type uncharacterized transport system permease subunit
MLQLVTIIKALAEVAGFALVGQGVLFLFAGARRDKNVPYQILKTITLPIFKVARLITPRLVLDQHLGLVAFLLVAIVWYLAAQHKLQLCLTEAPNHPACVDMVKAYNERRATQGG